MVAYSFKRRFADPIRAKLKRHTMRNDRKRHARVGERIQLYVSQRHPTGYKLGDATCTGVLRLRLLFDERRVEFESGHAITTPDDTDAFAVGDGFSSWADMEAFWRVEHPDVRAWSGVMIQWGYSFEPVVVR